MSNMPYFSTIGTLMCVMVCTKHDLSSAISAVCRYTHNLGKDH